ncbi:helix-turn-helix domain-containing protein [Actinomadura sp. ATCC 31491]|uniref:Helix-turn-helix domain-containing protein n=1 Tax=Actinomadura luzonensis TaxID=2805427 RepID=A0ABT0G3K3_9ACTN|nr:helix-turn-helix domain-containing protein [Actinomadura luzonensis]MCK2219189.1 helix-turn-helix domain-containing protein [Actinomadura luzonensis]
MRSSVRLAAGPGFALDAVTCVDDHRGWSAAELSDRHRVVLARRGTFHRRVEGRVAVVDQTVAYLGLPGEEEHFAHPAGGGDVCTSLALTPGLWRTLAGDVRPVRSALYVDARLDLAHRRVLAAARTGDAAFALTESLLPLIAAALSQVTDAPSPGSGRPAGMGAAVRAHGPAGGEEPGRHLPTRGKTEARDRLPIGGEGGDHVASRGGSEGQERPATHGEGGNRVTTRSGNEGQDRLATRGESGNRVPARSGRDGQNRPATRGEGGGHFAARDEGVGYFAARDEGGGHSATGGGGHSATGGGGRLVIRGGGGGGGRGRVPSRGGGGTEAVVVAAREAIAADHPAAAGLLSLAALLEVSPYRLSRAFTQELGVSLTHYRNRVRVGRALDRLEGGDTGLAELAADLGFADQAHMTRTIRRHAGHTPAVLRRLLSPGTGRAP